MSLVFNMVSGGGGGKLKDTDAVLIVTVPTGSTVTATKGGTTLTPTMWVKAADASLDCAIFSIPASQFDSTTPWTVTATNGANTASDTVLISTNKEYEVILSYKEYYYDSGNEFLDITGGWIGAAYTGNTGCTLTKELTYMDAKRVYGGNFSVITTNSIDLTSYSTLYFDIESKINVSTENVICGISLAGDTSFAMQTNTPYSVLYNNRSTISVDVTSASAGHIAIRLPGSGTTVGGSVYIYKVWGER